MTEKRFIGSSGGVYDQYKSNRFTWSEWEEILQIMNNLNEKARERSKALSKLQKENEKLRFKNRGLQSELQIFKEDVTHSNLQINKLAEENEQLKSELSEKDIQLDFLKDENKHMRDLVNENEQLKHDATVLIQSNKDYRKENEQLKEDVKYFNETYFVQEYGLDTETHVQLSSPVPSRKELLKENEQLKSELSRYKEVNRLDIWKSSYSLEDALITELQDKCDKKQEHIVILENKIRRMREAIHKLEWLATHRNAELIRENEQLKQFNQELNDELQETMGYLALKSGVEKENEQLKQDRKRLIGYLHRYGFVDVEDVDEIILNKEYLDEWGELYNDER